MAFGFVAGDVAGAVGCKFICPGCSSFTTTPLRVWTHCGFVVGFGLDLIDACCGFECERERGRER